MEATSTDRKVPLESGPMWRIWPRFIVPFITVPARMILPSTIYLSEIENSVLSS